ncbi:MAG: hypothetical protein HQK63_15815, partial [Desulfamplus sp.]|nr:hypothetical protein [Desulfamplus sp.]
MSNSILPENLKHKIHELSNKGHSTIEIFDFLIYESAKYVDSHEQLTRCISAIIKKRSPKKQSLNSDQIDKKIPKIKSFDNKQYAHIIESLSEQMNEKEFENSCEEIVADILENHEGFENIENANNVLGFTNPPFDFFALKEGKPYVIELKASLNNFNSPGETQKRRLKELLERIKELNIALLQVKLRKSEYRIFYNDDMNLF